MRYYLDKNTVTTSIGQNHYSIRNKCDGREVIVDEVGYNIIQAIDYRPQTTTDILRKVIAIYDNIEEEDILTDLNDFIAFLNQEEFIKQIPETLEKLQINLTEKCNERCVHCYIPERKRSKGEGLDYELIRRLINEFSEMGGREIVLSGGEALLRQDLDQIIEHAASKGFNISILSNLTLLTERLVNTLKKYHVDVQTSLYSTNEKIHDAITGRKGSCKKTKEAIQILCQEGIPVTISCIVMRTNKSDFIGVLEFGASTGASVQCNCGLNMDLDFNNKNLLNRLTEEEVRDFYVKLFNYHRENDDLDFSLRTHNISAMTESLEWYLKQYPCMELHKSCSINGNGDVCPCGSFGLVIGNVKAKSLKDIWYEAVSKNEVFNLLNQDMGACGSCQDFEYCYVCPSIKYNSGKGNFSEQDFYLCRAARIASEVEKEFNMDNN